jgi:hypothetical protein
MACTGKLYPLFIFTSHFYGHSPNRFHAASLISKDPKNKISIVTTKQAVNSADTKIKSIPIAQILDKHYVTDKCHSWMLSVLYISFYLLSVPVFTQYNYNVTFTLRYKMTFPSYLHASVHIFTVLVLFTHNTNVQSFYFLLWLFSYCTLTITF